MDLPGQVSYRPVDGAEAGDLCLNRITERPPRCHQLTKFEQWLPPTRTSVPLPPAKTFQRVKSQRNWLYKTHPEAFLGNADLSALISEETRAQKAAGSESQTGSVLAVGEIVDLRNSKSSRIAKCPVVALAAGEAGHILQLSVINSEKWLWNDSTFALGAPQTRFHGSWGGDGSPISKLEFVRKLKQHDNLYWVVVQKETSTTILEPELRAKPVGGTALVSAADAATAEHIVMNTVVTLTTDDTGGESHCDFSINLGSNDVAPQLAVIDRSGNWSVWYIEREGYGRGKTSRAVLKTKGRSILPASFPSDPSHVFEMYRILWTTVSNRADEWERDSSPSVLSDSLAGGPQAAYSIDIGESNPKYDGLLMCNPTQLQVSDVDGARLPASFDFLTVDGAGALLDAQAVHGSSSHVLVLTADKLTLLDVSFTEGQKKSPNMIASCRHFRKSPRETLQMSVTRLRSSSDEYTFLVLIYSAQSLRVDLFWFVVNYQDGTAKFHSQVVHFPGLKPAEAEYLQGIKSLAVVPLHLAPTKGKRREGTGEAADSFTDVQLCQLFALTTNLSLNATIVAITHGSHQNWPQPFKEDNSWWADGRRARFLRRKWLRETDQAFVIADQAEEVVKPLSITYVPSRVQKPATIQLRPYLLRLLQEINRGLLGDAAGNFAKLTGAEWVKSIQEALEGREEDDHVALKPILGFSNLWGPLNLTTLEDEVSSSLRRLKMSQMMRLFDCGIYGQGHSAMDLFEKVSINWSSALEAEALRPTQWRYMEMALERMAVEVYLSEKGVYMSPQSTLDLAAKSLPQEEIQNFKDEDGPDSQTRPSQAMWTPSRTPSSSRATSEAFGSSQGSQEGEDPGKEDPAVARLRMYLPSIKFTPPPKNGPSRVISLWPEQRGVDPSEYHYRPPGSDADEKTEAARRRREKEEDRRRRRAEKRAQPGIKLEDVGASLSQPYRPTVSRSSPAPPPSSQDAGSSQVQMYSQGVLESSQIQAHSQGDAGSGFGINSQRRSQPMGFARGFGYNPQTMSQPLPGEFGGRRPKAKKKPKPKGFK
ncbi:unnamed protein product [Discula destructiva]